MLSTIVRYTLHGHSRIEHTKRTATIRSKKAKRGIVRRTGARTHACAAPNAELGGSTAANARTGAGKEEERASGGRPSSRTNSVFVRAPVALGRRPRGGFELTGGLGRRAQALADAVLQPANGVRFDSAQRVPLRFGQH